MRNKSYKAGIRIFTWTRTRDLFQTIFVALWLVSVSSNAEEPVAKAAEIDQPSDSNKESEAQDARKPTAGPDTKQAANTEPPQAIEKKELRDPKALGETLRQFIRSTAETSIKNLQAQAQDTSQKITNVERNRTAEMTRVDTVINFIQKQLKAGATPGFQESIHVLETQGVDQALAYLESIRPATIEAANEYAEAARTSVDREKIKVEKMKRNQRLQEINLAAELLQVKLLYNFPLREQAIAIAPDWYEARNSLGRLYYRGSYYREAEPHLQAAAHLADNPIQEAESLALLGDYLNNTGRPAEALQHMRRALSLDERNFGPDGFTVTFRLNNLAALLLKTKQMSDAIPLMCRAIAINERALGTQHLAVAVNLSNLTVMLSELKREEESEPLHRRALTIYDSSTNLETHVKATGLNNFASSLKSRNRMNEALPLMRTAFELDEKALGPEGLNVARDLNNLAGMMKSPEQQALVEKMYHQAIAIDVHFSLKSGHEHPHLKLVTTSYQNDLKNWKVPAEEFKPRLEIATGIKRPLSPIAPEIEKVLGPNLKVEEVFAALDRHNKATNKPAVFFLPIEEPISHHFAELLAPTPASLNDEGAQFYHRNAHADAVVMYSECLRLMEEINAVRFGTFLTTVNRAVSLRELGDVEYARDELRRLISKFEEEPMTPVEVKWRAYYHLALCKYRLGDFESAEKQAELSKEVYKDEGKGAGFRKRSLDLIADIKVRKPLEPLPKSKPADEIRQARFRYQARQSLYNHSLKEPVTPILNTMLGNEHIAK